jgi:hypothetical protein
LSAYAEYAHRAHKTAMDALDYQKLVRHKNLGGNCDTCKHSVQKETLQCGVKKFKTVNKFAVCQLFEKDVS